MNRKESVKRYLIRIKGETKTRNDGFCKAAVSLNWMRRYWCVHLINSETWHIPKRENRCFSIPKKKICLIFRTWSLSVAQIGECARISRKVEDSASKCTGIRHYYPSFYCFIFGLCSSLCKVYLDWKAILEANSTSCYPGKAKKVVLSRIWIYRLENCP